jgi:hypothetical protein
MPHNYRNVSDSSGDYAPPIEKLGHRLTDSEQGRPAAIGNIQLGTSGFHVDLNPEASVNEMLT